MLTTCARNLGLGISGTRGIGKTQLLRLIVWHDFLAYVASQKKFLASHLEAGTALNLPPGQFTIGIAERHHLNYLQDADNLPTLKNLAKQFFNADVSVSITAVAAENIALKGDALGTGIEKGQESHMVKEALRIFGGSIKTARRDNG